MKKNSTGIPAIHQSHLQVTDIPNRIQRASDPNQKKGWRSERSQIFKPFSPGEFPEGVNACIQYGQIERLARLKDSMLLLARNFEVPFTNNAAERTIRNLKSKSKVAENFRSDDGARWYLKIRSYMDSARKHGINALEAVKLAIAGNPALCLGF
ncbi:MAG: transposase [Spirochaetia bacterium]|nr:transposase [Spirochaetia bacterium]